MINREKDETAIQNVLDQMNGDLDNNAFTCFRPIIVFLSEVEDPRFTTELNTYFKPKVEESQLDSAYQWLAGIIEQVSSPGELTLKSQIAMKEAAYYYDRTEAVKPRESRPAWLKAGARAYVMESLDGFVDKIKQNRCIIAAVFTSNLARDNVWEKTNINVSLITRDGIKSYERHSLVENGVNIDVTIYMKLV